MVTQKQQQRIAFCVKLYLFVKINQRLPSAKAWGLTLSGLSYTSRKLQDLNIIKKKGRNSGVYVALVDEKEAKLRIKRNAKQKFVRTTKGVNRKYKRVHSIQVKVKLPKFTYWLTHLPKYLRKKGIVNTTNGKGQIKIEFQYNGYKYIFLLCKNRSIIFYLPEGVDFISDDVEFAMIHARSHARKVLYHFSDYFGKDLRIKGEFYFKITRKHIAMMDNLIAKRLHKDRKQLRVFINGKLRVITDKSFNWDELEAINNRKAESDVDSMERMIKDVVTQKHTISDVKNDLENQLKENDNNMLRMAKQISEQNKALQILLDKAEKEKSISRWIH